MTSRVKNSSSTRPTALKKVAPASIPVTPTAAVRRKSVPVPVPAEGVVHPAVDNLTEAKLPHERDESVSAAAPEPSAPMQQAFEDLARGLQDTDRGAELGRTYKKLKR